MKQIIIIVLLFIGMEAHSQVDSAVNIVVTKQINKFSTTLDSTVFYTVTTIGATSTTISLPQPLNTVTLYHMSLQGANVINKDVCEGDKSVQIKNVNGTVTVTRNADVPVYLGQNTLAKATWGITTLNNVAIIKVTGLAGLTISWTVSYSSVTKAL